MRCPKCNSDKIIIKNGTMLDPFAGTGETAVVAKKMNRHCTLIDIDEKMYYGLCGRFNQTA